MKELGPLLESLTLGLGTLLVGGCTLVLVATLLVIGAAVAVARRGSKATLAALASEGLVLESGWIWLTHRGVMMNEGRTTHMRLALTRNALVLFSNKPFLRVDARDFPLLDVWMVGDRLHLAPQVWSQEISFSNTTQTVRRRAVISSRALDAPRWMNALSDLGARVHRPA